MIRLIVGLLRLEIEIERMLRGGQTGENIKTERGFDKDSSGVLWSRQDWAEAGSSEE